jgi:hypothetical protein
MAGKTASTVGIVKLASPCEIDLASDRSISQAILAGDAG